MQGEVGAVRRRLSAAHQGGKLPHMHLAKDSIQRKETCEGVEGEEVEGEGVEGEGVEGEVVEGEGVEGEGVEGEGVEGEGGRGNRTGFKLHHYTLFVLEVSHVIFALHYIHPCSHQTARLTPPTLSSPAHLEGRGAAFGSEMEPRVAGAV